jgi:molybdopterin-containing oxidoreductase family iron-sulfur binding subunit
MGINRREFLKVAGISTLIGLGGKAAFELLAPGEIEAALEEVPLTAGKKWGMVVDMTKMDEKVMDKLPPNPQCPQGGKPEAGAQMDLERDL